MYFSIYFIEWQEAQIHFIYVLFHFFRVHQHNSLSSRIQIKQAEREYIVKLTLTASEILTSASSISNCPVGNVHYAVSMLYVVVYALALCVWIDLVQATKRGKNPVT